MTTQPAATRVPSATKKPSEAWTVPLHVIMWTTMMIGLIMVFVVVMMR